MEETEDIQKIVEEISDYEVSEDAFRRSCCTAWDLCNHEVQLKIPIELWFRLKKILVENQQNKLIENQQTKSVVADCNCGCYQR